MRVGIIGSGSICEYHIRALQRLGDVTVHAITSLDPSRTNQVAERYGISHTPARAEELIADPTIDAVSIAVWNADHARLGIAALKAGKHVFCEKPIARNAREAMEMAVAERTAGRVLMVGMVRRFDEKTRIAKQILDEGLLGEIYSIKAGYLRRDGQPGGWFTDREKSGGGALIDIGVHILDLALHVTGLESVRSVRGTTFSLPGIMLGVEGSMKYQSVDAGRISDVEDCAIASVFFENGAHLQLESCWAQHIKEGTSYLQIFGTKGGLTIDPELKLFTNRWNTVTDTTFPHLKEGLDIEEMFYREFKHFRDCVVDGVPCRCPSSDGIDLMRVIDAIYASAQSGREVLLDGTDKEGL